MSDENLESLMRDVARTVQGDARRRQLLPEIQARLAKLDEQSRQSQRAHGTWRLSLLGAAACAAGVAIFVMRPMPLQYAVDGAGAAHAGAVGERLAGSDAGPVALRFSDGSQVTLPAQAQAHVDALDARGATVALEGGTVDVSVVHRAKTRWSVRAGRYTIRVTGTKFSAGWDRKSDTLTVTMREGSVEVTGPGMKAPARVVGGQRLRANDVAVDHPDDQPEVVVEDVSVAAKAPAEPAAAQEEEAPAPAVTAMVESEAATPKTVAPSRRELDRRASRGRHGAAPVLVASNDGGWRALYRRGKWELGLAAAQQEGFEEICAQGSVNDVISLGELARLAHDYNRAQQAYLAANRRFDSPAEAVMGLGRLEFDQHKNPAAAARWFALYVKRFPHGPVAQEAAGLLLESRLKAGDNAGARDAAAAYLRSFSDGPRAKQARDIVSH
jgi:TolA-binding protein